MSYTYEELLAYIAESAKQISEWEKQNAHQYFRRGLPLAEGFEIFRPIPFIGHCLGAAGLNDPSKPLNPCKAFENAEIRVTYVADGFAHNRTHGIRRLQTAVLQTATEITTANSDSDGWVNGIISGGTSNINAKANLEEMCTDFKKLYDSARKKAIESTLRQMYGDISPERYKDYFEVFCRDSDCLEELPMDTNSTSTNRTQTYGNHDGNRPQLGPPTAQTNIADFGIPLPAKEIFNMTRAQANVNRPLYTQRCFAPHRVRPHGGNYYRGAGFISSHCIIEIPTAIVHFPEAAMDSLSVAFPVGLVVLVLYNKYLVLYNKYVSQRKRVKSRKNVEKIYTMMVDYKIQQFLMVKAKYKAQFSKPKLCPLFQNPTNS
jgi:hypothetical protein